jgi:drug/metabolite transporter (DMT)-like permease
MLAANAGLTLTVIFWGSLVPVLADLLQRWDPYLLSVLRYGMAVPILLILRRCLEPGPLFQAGDNLPSMVAAGFLLAAFATLYTVGVAHSNPITAAVLSACSPVIAGVVEWIGTKIALRWSFILALPLTISGALLGTLDFHSENIEWGFHGGEISILLGSACWATYSFIVKYRLANCSHFRVASLSIGFGVIFLFLVYIVEDAAGMTMTLVSFPTADFAKIAWVSLGAVVGGIYFWNRGVRKLGVSIASLHLNLIPFIAIATAMWFGIFPKIEQLLGCFLVVAGIFVTQIFGGAQSSFSPLDKLSQDGIELQKDVKDKRI